MKVTVQEQLSLKFQNKEFTSDKMLISLEFEVEPEKADNILQEYLPRLYQIVLKEHLIRGNMDLSQYKRFIETYRENRESLNASNN